MQNKLQRKEDTINESERGLSILRGFFLYLQQNHLVYECKVDSFNFDNKKILKWKSTGIFNYSDYYSINGIEESKKEMPILKNDERMYVYLQGSHFQQNNVLTINNDHVININVVNIYIVYKLYPILLLLYKMLYLELCKLLKILILQNMTTKDMVYVLMKFAHKITEGGHAHTTDARNVLIF